MILGTLCNEKGVGDRRTGTPVARVPNKMGRLGAPCRRILYKTAALTDGTKRRWHGRTSPRL